MAKRGDYEFIFETSNYRRIITIIVALIIVAFLGIVFLNPETFFIDKIVSLPFVEQGYNAVQSDVLSLNMRGIFYITFLGDLFFNPIPPEVFFYGALAKGSLSYFSLIVVTMIAMFLAHVVNYYLGRRFSLFFMSFVSIKNVSKIRSKVNRYGSYAVLIFNILPLPAPLLTFALGITRYNKYRLFVLLIIGNIIKRVLMIASYVLFNFTI